jgi:endonuclease/exonuclease/phosphatase family metal-dependent hydrolase
LRAGERTVDVFNVHFGLTPEQRKEQASAVLTLLGSEPSIVAGDLNATPDSPVLEILSGRLRDTLAAAGAKTPSRIDYVLVTAELDVLSSRVVSAPPAELASDHLPCAADVRLGSAPRGAEAQGVLDADDKRVDQALGE